MQVNTPTQNLSYKFRIYPNREQQQLFASTFGCVRLVYNKMLAYRDSQYSIFGNSVNFNACSKILTELKNTDRFSFLNNVSSVALQQSLKNMDVAYTNFFKGRASFPTFKKKINKQSFRLVNGGFSIKDGELHIAKSKQPLKVKWSRDLDFSKYNSITISQEPSGKYFVSINGEKDIKQLSRKNNVIGLDLGIKELIIGSNGVFFNNPKFTKKYENKLAKAQKRLAKKKKGSSNRNKARIKVAKIHEKISNCRKDNNHKITSQIINENQVICLETIKVKNMIKNRKLSKALSDASFASIVSMLEYKSSWYGRTISKIDTFFPSSKTCNNCGCIKKELKLSDRIYNCYHCGHNEDRDINAAKNIRDAGLALLACGDTAIGG